MRFVQETCPVSRSVTGHRSETGFEHSEIWIMGSDSASAFMVVPDPTM